MAKYEYITLDRLVALFGIVYVIFKHQTADGKSYGYILTVTGGWYEFHMNAHDTFEPVWDCSWAYSPRISDTQYKEAQALLYAHQSTQPA